MKKLIPLVGLVAFVFTACSKKELNYTERKIVGEWYYEKVKAYKVGKLGGDVITHEYHSQKLVFQSNFDFIFKDEVGTHSGEGIWDLTEGYTDENASQNIVISYTENESGKLHQLIFENMGVTHKKLTASFYDKDTTFYYTLRKF